MNAIPSVSLIDESCYEQYKNFLKDCIEYSLDSNFKQFGYPTNYDKETFYSWLGTDKIYICNRNNKNIGFIVLETKDMSESTAHQVSFYIHPKVCKLASLSIARSAAVLSYCSLLSYDDDTIFSTTIHSLVYGVFALLFEVKALKNGSYYLFTAKIRDVTPLKLLESFDPEDLKPYFEMFNLPLLC